MNKDISFSSASLLVQLFLSSSNCLRIKICYFLRMSLSKSFVDLIYNQNPGLGFIHWFSTWAVLVIILFLGVLFMVGEDFSHYIVFGCVVYGRRGKVKL